MWETKYVDDMFEMLLTVLAIFVTKIIYLSTYLCPKNDTKILTPSITRTKSPIRSQKHLDRTNINIGGIVFSRELYLKSRHQHYRLIVNV